MQIMITEDAIKESFIQKIVFRDFKIIKDTQQQVVNDNLNIRSGKLSQNLTNYHYHIEGTHFQFLTLNYLRFLDIRYRKDRMYERRNLALYNKVIWGVLYHETLPTLKYGLTEDIKKEIKKQYKEFMGEQSI